MAWTNFHQSMKHTFLKTALGRARSEWWQGEGTKMTTDTEFSDKHLLFKSMHKTKPISQEPHVHRRIQTSLAASSPQHETSDSPPLPPWSLQLVEAEQSFTIDDFLRSLQAQQLPYYFCHLSDPYFGHYFDHESDADQPTAPLRARPCIDRINRQYMGRIGPLRGEDRENRVKVGRQLRVKYFRGEDEADKIKTYQEYIEEDQQGEEMEGEADQ